MNPILRSLETITTGYSVFEKDQVLTHDQLNSVADYCDDQDRLTRTKLLGVGIVCGLRLSMANDAVTVTKGVGITTDGDLLYLSNDTVFDKFKLYDDSNPKYDPFYTEDKLNTVYQLLAQGTAETDAEAKGLSSFATDTGGSFDNMVAVLFMEGYVKDQDVCSGTDCDNLGQDFVNAIKLLLVDKGLVGALQKSVPTPGQAASALSEIVADRALLSSSITTAAQLATVYRTTTNSIEGKLVTELPKLYLNCATFLGDVFDSDPSASWVATLNSVNTTFAGNDSGIQYYYDFLKDVVATYNDLRELLLTSGPIWCCPEIDAFPKHVLLGNLGAAAVSPAPRPVLGGGITRPPIVDLGGIRTIRSSILTRSALPTAPVSPISIALPGGPVPTVPPGGSVPTVPPVGPISIALPGGPVPTVPPGGPVPTVPPVGPVRTVPPGGPVPTVPPVGPISIALPGGPVPTVPPGGPVPTVPPGGPVPTVPPGGPVPTVPPGGPVPTVPPVGSVPTVPPGGPVPTTPPVDPVPTGPPGGSVPIVPPGGPVPTVPPVDPVPTMSSEPAENRTGFYPSPIVACSVEALAHVQFLARKLDTLIQTFQVPVAGSTLRVTPSVGEESGLEERAIPYYYQVNSTDPIQKSWNYRLHQQGMDASNYSYNASAYGAQGAAASPLTAQLGRFSFFRIEGHLGQDVSSARTEIEAQITSGNLPFTVQAVFLGSDKTKVIKKPGFVFGDLHRLHQVLRADLSDQLNNAQKFSDHYAEQVINTSLIPDKEVDKTFLNSSKDIATNMNDTFKGAVSTAQAALTKSYTNYKLDARWTPAVSTAMTTGAQFKQNLGTITQTTFNTPFDSLVSLSHVNWLNWLDIHIKHTDDKEVEKLLFSAFQSLHPGLEHFAGVVRGGTFVLAYDESNHVVGDFMLPYYCPEPVREEDPEEPTLPVITIDDDKTPVKGPTILNGGIKLTPVFDKYISTRLDDFSANDPRIKFQSDLVDKTFNLVGGLATGVTTKFEPGGLGQEVTNPLLDGKLLELRGQQLQIDFLNQKIADPTTADADRTAAKTELETKEHDFADKSGAVADLLASAKEGEISSSDKNVALTTLSTSPTLLSNTDARAKIKTAFDSAKTKATDVGLKNRLDQIGATFG